MVTDKLIVNYDEVIAIHTKEFPDHIDTRIIFKNGREIYTDVKFENLKEGAAISGNISSKEKEGD